MEKIKRAFALIVVGVLVCLSVSTLLIALFGGENSQDLLMVAIFASVIIPVLLYGLSLAYRVSNRDKFAPPDENEDK